MEVSKQSNPVRSHSDRIAMPIFNAICSSSGTFLLVSTLPIFVKSFPVTGYACWYIRRTGAMQLKRQHVHICLFFFLFFSQCDKRGQHLPSPRL